MHGYLYLIIGLGMAISICILIQYTLTWNPMYKNISTRTEISISRQQAMFNVAKTWDVEYCPSKAETQWTPGVPMGIPDDIFLKPIDPRTNVIIPPGDIAEIWSTLDTPIETAARTPSIEVIEAMPEISRTMSEYETQRQRDALYTIDSNR